MQETLNPQEQEFLLRLAREAIESAVQGKELLPLDLAVLPPPLREEGCSFVTLTIQGQLRGCIGALNPYQALAEDVREHAAAAALHDPRFPPVREYELPQIQIEISRLTHAVPLEYKDANDLLAKLQPHKDGVIVRDAFRRATFLPQVWEKIPDPAEFMDNLCYKLGVKPDSWRSKHLEILTYQVEDFHE